MIAPIFETIGKIHIFEKDQHKQLSDPRKSRILTTYVCIAALVPILAVIIAIIAYVTESNQTKIVALGLLIVGYLLVYLLPIFSAFVYRSTIREVLHNPLLPQLTNASITLISRNQFLPELLRYSLDELETAAVELKTERDAFERRIGLVVGAVEKVGLGPGLLAAIAAIVKLQNDLKGVGSADWLLGAAYALLGLYLLAMIGHMSIIKIDRALKLLDSAITKKKAQDDTSTQSDISDQGAAVEITS